MTRHYASGTEANENMLNSSKHTDPEGLDLFALSYNLMVYAWCRTAADTCLDYLLAEQGPGRASETASPCARDRDNFSQLVELVLFPLSENSLQMWTMRRVVSKKAR